MVIVVQLVRTPDCDSGGRGFEPHHSPQTKAFIHEGFFFFNGIADCDSGVVGLPAV